MERMELLRPRKRRKRRKVMVREEQQTEKVLQRGNAEGRRNQKEMRETRMRRRPRRRCMREGISGNRPRLHH